MSKPPQRKDKPQFDLENSANGADNKGIRRLLRRVSRSRTRLVVCFWTLPVYVMAIWILLDNGREIDSMMWIYMAVYAAFAIDMSMRRCPACHHQFYVKSIFLNLLSRDCVHCGQASCRFELDSKD